MILYGNRKFVANFSGIARPLNELTEANTPFEWTKARQRAFDELKDALTSSPVLRSADFTRPFQLHTDWAKTGLGVVLSQRDDGKHKYVVAYASRNTNKAESNYSIYERKALAVVSAVTHFRHYLYGKRFTLITDHQPLE